MKFFEKYKELLLEIFKFKKYKNMGRALAVFEFIFMLPFFLMFLFGVFFGFVGSILFGIIKSPVEYLHKTVHDEGQTVMHATQFIIYFISWPVIFFAYIWISLLTIFIYFNYILTSINGYIWSLCGYKFHLFITDEIVTIEKCKMVPTWKPLAHIIASACLLLIEIIVGITVFVNLYNAYRESLFMMQFMPVALALFFIYFVFTVVYVAIAYRNKTDEFQSLATKVDKELPAKATK